MRDIFTLKDLAELILEMPPNLQNATIEEAEIWLMENKSNMHRFRTSYPKVEHWRLQSFSAEETTQLLEGGQFRQR